MFDFWFPRGWSTLKKLMWLKAMGVLKSLWSTITGNPVTFTAKAAPLRQLSVSMSPKQNLNGYSNPWPAGGGINKADYPAILAKGATVQSDGSLHVLYASSLNNVVIYQNDGTSGQFAITFTYKTAGTSRGVFPKIKYTDGTEEAASVITGSTTYVTVTKVSNSGKTVDNIYLVYGNNVETWFYVQVVKGETALDWTPYSNICPITGYDSLTVTQTGKNLFDVSKETEGYRIGPNGVVGSSDNYCVSDYIPVKGGETYYFLNVSRAYDSNAGCWFDKDKTFIESVSVAGGADHKASAEKQAPANAAYLRINHWNGVADVGINYPSTDHDYHAYNPDSQTIPITIPTPPGTVYSGTLDVLTGVLTVDKVGIALDAERWQWKAYAAWGSDHTWWDGLPSDADVTGGTIYVNPAGYQTSFLRGGTQTEGLGGTAACFYVRGDNKWFYMSIPGVTTSTALETALAGQTLVYPLVTPQTYQLTPQEVSSLLGTNNMWTDADTLTVEYRSN